MHFAFAFALWLLLVGLVSIIAHCIHRDSGSGTRGYCICILHAASLQLQLQPKPAGISLLSAFMYKTYCQMMSKNDFGSPLPYHTAPTCSLEVAKKLDETVKLSFAVSVGGQSYNVACQCQSQLDAASNTFSTSDISTVDFGAVWNFDSVFSVSSYFLSVQMNTCFAMRVSSPVAVTTPSNCPETTIDPSQAVGLP
jgi:hypothetical protein